MRSFFVHKLQFGLGKTYVLNYEPVMNSVKKHMSALLLTIAGTRPTQIKKSPLKSVFHSTHKITAHGSAGRAKTI